MMFDKLFEATKLRPAILQITETLGTPKGKLLFPLHTFENKMLKNAI